MRQGYVVMRWYYCKPPELCDVRYFCYVTSVLLLRYFCYVTITYIINYNTAGLSSVIAGKMLPMQCCVCIACSSFIFPDV